MRSIRSKVSDSTRHTFGIVYTNICWDKVLLLILHHSLPDQHLSILSHDVLYSIFRGFSLNFSTKGVPLIKWVKVAFVSSDRRHFQMPKQVINAFR
jgi:hypothetical protein